MNTKQAEIMLANRVLDSGLMNHSIYLKINRYFTDVNGTVIAKNTVPASLQIKFPFFMFGSFDSLGGYTKSLQEMPVLEGSEYLTSFIQGAGFSSNMIVGFSGVNTIKNVIKTGDIVHVFTDSVQNPNYFIWIVQNASSQSIGSIIGNSRTSQKDDVYNRMWVNNIHYTVANANVYQWNEQVRVLKYNNLGLVRSDDWNPNTNRTPTQNYLNDIVILPIKFKVDQYISLSTYFQFASEGLEFVYNIKK